MRIDKARDKAYDEVFDFLERTQRPTFNIQVKGRRAIPYLLGNKGVIGSGDVQWMTAGSGIVHQEMPKGDKQGRMYGFQLWANLPARQKMMDPRYRDVTAKDIPEVKLPGGVAVKVVAGEVAGTRFLLISGKPLGEPVAWYGPIVMNTQEELRLAFEEYERGTFLKHHR